MNIKKIYALIITFIFIAGTTPLVLAAKEDTIVITFNPHGKIEIDISHSSWNYSSIQANEWGNTTGEQFTLFNNGTIAMDTEIKTNSTSVEGDMKLNSSTAAPTTDEYAIYIEDLDTPQYINTSYATHGFYDTNLAASGSKSFDICILIGTALSANHSWQTVNITFRGSES
jgi:hypothetical protein